MTLPLIAEGEARSVDIPLLSVVNLTTVFRTTAGLVRAVDDVSFDLMPGKILGIVGESGSGKSVTALSLLRLVPSPGEIQSGRILLSGDDIVRIAPRKMADIRGRRIGLIPQDPMTSLNPTLTVGYQIAEPLRKHLHLSRAAARSRTLELFDQVGIPSPAARIGQYPHEFSGGMLQRAAIAMALSCEPELLIADEPTTALDVTIQAQILELLAEISRERAASTILITHDIGVAAQICDQVAVMYAGQIVEYGSVHDVFRSPQMPYTRGLLRSVPRLDDPIGMPFLPIGGGAPNLADLGPGCRFAPRCEWRREPCGDRYPPLTRREYPDRLARCYGTEPGGWID